MRCKSLIVTLAFAALAACSGKPDASTPATDAAPSGAPSETASETPAKVPASGPALSDATVQLPAVPGRPAVAYFTLNSDSNGKLVSVAAAHFARAEMHESKMEGGAMTMSQVDAVPIAPGKPITFAPGGYHVMLFDMDGSLKPGDTTDLTATLDNGAKVNAKAKVTAPGGDMKM